MDLDTRTRLHVYRTFAERGSPPTAEETATALGIEAAEARESYRRLADARVIVLEPGSDEIWMANPLSARPTDFEVTTADGRRYHGNCTWDGPGVLAMLHTDGDVATHCPDCEEPMRLEVRDGSMTVPGGGVAHFAVPAKRWWEDIGFT